MKVRALNDGLCVRRNDEAHVHLQNADHARLSDEVCDRLADGFMCVKAMKIPDTCNVVFLFLCSEMIDVHLNVRLE